MENKATKRLKRLKLHVIISTFLLLGFLFTQSGTINFACDGSTNLTTDSLNTGFLTVQHLDVIEPNGSLGIRLSNSKSNPLPRWDWEKNRSVSKRHSSNIVFFDGKGDEVDDINFSKDHENGNTVGHLAFDGYGQDEMIAMSHFMYNSVGRKGFHVHDIPQIEISDALDEMDIRAEDDTTGLDDKLQRFKMSNPTRYDDIWLTKKRVVLQTNSNDEAEMILSDGNGQRRLHLMVSEDGRACIAFFDQNGMVTKRFDGEG